jgi:hypothetical protein
MSATGWIEDCIHASRNKGYTFAAENAVTELAYLIAENKKLCDLLAERYEEYLKVCAENTKFRKVLDEYRDIEDDFDCFSAACVLAKYPEAK